MIDGLRLGDHCKKIGSGSTPRGGKDTYLESGPFSLVRSQNIHNDGFKLDGLVFISEEQARLLRNVELQAGDVLLNITGDSVARACQVDPRILPARVNQHVAIIRPDENRIDPAFLRYWLVDPRTQDYLLALASAGATRKALTKLMIEDLRLPSTAIETQRGIGSILTSLDDKIELNRRMNETLEALAQAIFKDWFVDFGPTRRKAEGATDPVAILGSLIPDKTRATEIASLFPATFNNDGLPEGWIESPFSSLVEIIGGGTPKTSEPSFWGGDIPWFSVTDTPKGSDTFVFETEKNITAKGLAGSSARMIETGTSIITARGTVGNLAIAGRKMTFNQSCYGLTSAVGVLPYFVYVATGQIIERLKSNAHGSVFSTITRQTFESVPFIAPPFETRMAYEEIVATLFQRVRAAVQENRTLAETRDYLLPKLMSGQVRVREAEKMAESAA